VDSFCVSFPNRVRLLAEDGGQTIQPLLSMHARHVRHGHLSDRPNLVAPQRWKRSDERELMQIRTAPGRSWEEVSRRLPGHSPYDLRARPYPFHLFSLHPFEAELGKTVRYESQMVFETMALSGPQKLWGRSNGAGLSQQIIVITFTWSGPRGVAGYTEAHACAWHVCQLSLSDPELPAVWHPHSLPNK
jgi:hypothetical protein